MAAEERSSSSRSAILFYRYFAPPCTSSTLDRLAQWHKDRCGCLGIRGRIILGTQGINGTLGGTPEAMDAYIREAEQLEEMDEPSSSSRQLFKGIDWKRTECDLGEEDPEIFPDLVVNATDEILPSGGMPYPTTSNGELIGGTHLSPKDFHERIAAAKEGDDMVLLDVRNRHEYAVGHFVDAAGRHAIQPNMRNFKSFQHFVDEKGPELLAGKRVMMYCTGGIRCETASAYLASKGLASEVCQLHGGIHRYADETGSDGFFKGKNVVFDRRIAVPTGSRRDNASENDVVGRCSECCSPYDDLQASVVCTVCQCMVLVCPTCRKNGVASNDAPDSVLRRFEWFCEEHTWLRGTYFFFLDVFDIAALRSQKTLLEKLLAELSDDKTEHDIWQRHLMVSRQLKRVDERLDSVERLCELQYQKQSLEKVLAQLTPAPDGEDDPKQQHLVVSRRLQRAEKKLAALEKTVSFRDASLPLPCRVCQKGGCDGRCWGFWKNPHQSSQC